MLKSGDEEGRKKGGSIEENKKALMEREAKQCMCSVLESGYG